MQCTRVKLSSWQSAANAPYSSDYTVGVCVTPEAAGSACTKDFGGFLDALAVQTVVMNTGNCVSLDATFLCCAMCEHWGSSASESDSDLLQICALDKLTLACSALLTSAPWRDRADDVPPTLVGPQAFPMACPILPVNQMLHLASFC